MGLCCCEHEGQVGLVGREGISPATYPTYLPYLPYPPSRDRVACDGIGVSPRSSNSNSS
jgi:hypothetical protein